MPEVQGTIKHMSKTGKGFQLDQYENWFNFGYDYEGPRPFARGAAITVTYDQKTDAETGEDKFWVMQAWPTTGQRPQPEQSPKPAPGPTPVAAPKVSSGPTPAQPAPVGPTPVPANRDNFILFETCLARAQDWVLATEPEGSAQRCPAHVLFVADLYYLDGLKVINGKEEAEMQHAPPQSYQEYQEAASSAISDAAAGPPPEEPA